MIAAVRKNLFSFVLAILLAIFLLLCRINTVPKSGSIKPIAWDIYGYYLYLPSTLIYGDPGLEQSKWLEETQKKYEPSPFIYQYAGGQHSRKVNIYPMGLAVIYAPGFFMAHCIAKCSSFPADGFSPPYQWAVLITAMAYMCLGVFLLRALLLKFFSDRLSGLLLLIIVLGTNYLAHVGLDGTSPHNFMFVFNCLILLLTIRWHEQHKLTDALLLGLFIGLTTLSRPTELIWILVPVLWGIKDSATLKDKLRLLKQHKRQVLAFVLALTLTGLPQLLYWKWTAGTWLSYNHVETFSFLEPYTLEFLFSYKKGWLLYTPVMLLALAGFYTLFRKEKGLFYPLFIFTCMNIYVLSSWDCWWYAASFSQRPMVEAYPLLAIPLGFFIQSPWQKQKAFTFSLLLLIPAMILLNLFQTWQATIGLIDPERMTKEYYWKIFGRTKLSSEKDLDLLSIDRGKYGNVFSGDANAFYKKEIMSHDFETKLDNVDSHFVVDTFGFQSRHCYKMDTINSFSPGINEVFYDLTNKDYAWARMSVQIFSFSKPELAKAYLVGYLESKGTIWDYRTMGLDTSNAKPGQWNTLRFDYLSPYIHHKDDKLHFYFWYTGKGTVFIDDLKIDLWEPKVSY